MDFQEISASSVETPLKNNGIRPVGHDTVKKLHQQDLQAAKQIVHGYGDHDYQPMRNAQQLLTPGYDYAQLPGYKGKTPASLLQDLPKGANLLDIGCADGSFAREVKDTLNKDINVYGFDGRKTKNQEVNLDGIVIGNIYDLTRQSFPDTDFDLVLSTALLYHLSDPLFAISRMAEVVKQNGILLVSTVRRIIKPGTINWEETESSLDYEYGNYLRYWGGSNIYDLQGRLIPSRESTQLLGEKLGFNMQYGVATAKNNGARTVGGQISGKKTHYPHDSINFFYCMIDADKLPDIWKERLGYIVAKTQQEAQILQDLGFVKANI